MTRKPRMTAAEWDTSRAPKKMLLQVQESGSLRQLRLFTCACCRAVWDRLDNEHCRRGVEVAEQFADGLVTDAARLRAQKRVDATLDESGQRDIIRLCASWALCSTGRWDLSFGVEVVSQNTRSVVKGPGFRRVQADLLRCVFGNPFRKATLAETWRTSDTVALARGISQDRAFDRMPILADALQDAGCDDEHILNHCREPQTTHARGCWVVDLILWEELTDTSALC
jgi:hypothetical protein